ncbi:MAG TPA: hypothetical protein VJ227_04420 [Patescibacteria group bacterium]|nr:hypothetical protein [Patescibacteria group bacterium]
MTISEKDLPGRTEAWILATYNKGEEMVTRVIGVLLGWVGLLTIGLTYEADGVTFGIGLIGGIAFIILGLLMMGADD